MNIVKHLGQTANFQYDSVDIQNERMPLLYILRVHNVNPVQSGSDMIHKEISIHTPENRLFAVEEGVLRGSDYYVPEHMYMCS